MSSEIAFIVVATAAVLGFICAFLQLRLTQHWRNKFHALERSVMTKSMDAFMAMDEADRADWFIANTALVDRQARQIDELKAVVAALHDELGVRGSEQCNWCEGKFSAEVMTDTVHGRLCGYCASEFNADARKKGPGSVHYVDAG